MHSSRMRAMRSHVYPTACTGHRVSQHALPRGLSAQGVSTREGVFAQGLSARGVSAQVEMSAWGSLPGGAVSQHALRQTTPPPSRTE